MNLIIIAFYKAHLIDDLEYSYAMNTSQEEAIEALHTGDEIDFWHIYESNRMYIQNMDWST